MRVAIVGGGDSGAAIARAVRERGGEPMLLSRSTGFNVLDAAAPEKLRTAHENDGGIDVFVEATGTTAASAKASTTFFSRSARTVSAAAHLFGARHILLSIVGCHLPVMQGFGYYAGKTAQERTAREVSDELTIIRSTQWFEFGRQMLRRMSFGAIAMVPSMRMQPIALDAVADAIADSAAHRANDDVLELAGPEVMPLRELILRLPTHPRIVLPLRIPNRWGKGFRDGALLPSDGARVAGPTLTEWLSRQRSASR